MAKPKFTFILSKEQIEDLLFSNRISKMKPVISDLKEQYKAILISRQELPSTKSALPYNHTILSDHEKEL